MLYEVSNRGGKGMLAFYNQAAGSLDPTTDAQMGDGFLMTQGFTLLWVGWQFDPPHREGLVRVFAPIATDNGKPIVGHRPQRGDRRARDVRTRRSPIAITSPTRWRTRTIRPTR